MDVSRTVFFFLFKCDFQHVTAVFRSSNHLGSSITDEESMLNILERRYYLSEKCIRVILYINGITS